VASHGFGVVVYSCYLFLFVACTIALGMVLGRYCVVSVGFSWYLNPPDSLVVGREGHRYVVDVPALLLLPSPNALYGNPHLLHTTQRPSHDPTQLVGPASSEDADFVGTAIGFPRMSLPANSVAAGAPPVTEQRRHLVQSPQVRVTRSPSRTVMQRLVTSALDQHGDS
jgi:hypothetical protein